MWIACDGKMLPARDLPDDVHADWVAAPPLRE